jgi:hypothetical protein
MCAHCYRRFDSMDIYYNSNHNIDKKNDSSASSDFFSPVSAQTGNTQQLREQSTPLPPLHDTSWIGARLSPIQSFDHEDAIDEEDARHDRLHASLRGAAFVHERTHLLGSSFYNNTNNKPVQLHPLWEGTTTSSAPKTNRNFRVTWGLIVVVASGLLLLVMLVWESVLRGGNAGYSVRGRPSNTTLQIFGAYTPNQSYQQQYWRLTSSAFCCASLVDWMLIAVSWRLIFLAATHVRWYKWAGIYFSAVLVGQLWSAITTTYLANANAESVAYPIGCATFGTAGVLTAVGIYCPSRRFAFFVCAAALVIAAYVQQQQTSLPCLVGILASAFFGWALACSEETKHSKKDPDLPLGRRCALLQLWTCRTITMVIVISPVVVIALLI